LIKSDSKDIYNVTKDFFQINAVLLNILFIKESWNKCIYKNINSTTVLYTDNNKKCFSSGKSEYYNDLSCDIQE